MSAPDVLPDSRLTTISTAKGAVYRNGAWWVPVFCANCGEDGGLVMQNGRFAFYLCNDCAEHWSPMAGIMLIPDEVHWQLCRAEQLERYGRELSIEELQEIRDAGLSPLAALLREGSH